MTIENISKQIEETCEELNNFVYGKKTEVLVNAFCETLAKIIAYADLSEENEEEIFSTIRKMIDSYRPEMEELKKLLKKGN